MIDAADSNFEREVDRLINRAEQDRLAHMEKYQFRGFVSITVSLSLVTLGGIGFGWFLIMEADLVRAFASILLAVSVSFLVHGWARAPLKRYQNEYKNKFMPEMSALLGGLQFHPQRGISASVLAKTGIVPQFGTYQAEDCLMGRHKDVKVILSEARLSHPRNKNERVFDGIFVMLAMPQDHFDGHTIITSDERAVQNWQNTRWKQLASVDLSAHEHRTGFHAFSDKPDVAERLITDDLLREMEEMSEAFDGAPISLCLFRKSRVFIMIPCADDMFEPSNLYVPITTRRNALKLKLEIEKLTSIIDILHLYTQET